MSTKPIDAIRQHDWRNQLNHFGNDFLFLHQITLWRLCMELINPVDDHCQHLGAKVLKKGLHKCFRTFFDAFACFYNPLQNLT